MSNILGISAGFHDAAVSIIDNNGDILFAGHSERYSKIKNDHDISHGLLEEIKGYGYDHIAYYEVPWRRRFRGIFSGEGLKGDWSIDPILKKHLRDVYDPRIPKSCHRHHLSHAAAGFQTSPFNDAVVIVIDAIGELDTISIYDAYYDSRGIARYKKLWSQSYPHSIGLFYSAITKRVGLKPLDEEYITMGMAAWGKPTALFDMYDYAIDDLTGIKFERNFHIGIDEYVFAQYSNEDIACAAQKITTNLINQVKRKARELSKSENLVYMGGVALNCMANSCLTGLFSNTWIMPNPGDAGSSLGAAALVYGKKLQWKDAFLGYNIEGEYPVDGLIKELLSKQIVGVANGRAEFGPRALGNRSLLADPRGPDIKDRVNEIKRRQKFRPFAPVILEEYVHDYFKMPFGWDTSPYMQIVAVCKDPQLFPAIVHVDDTSRVQTVSRDGSGIRKLLEEWHAQTGCPMLLNTSLNIRGEPMVNDLNDARRFEETYGVRVLS